MIVVAFHEVEYVVTFFRRLHVGHDAAHGIERRSVRLVEVAVALCNLIDQILALAGLAKHP